MIRCLFYRFLTSNGLEREETGQLVGNQGKEGFQVTGFYRYVDDAGVIHENYYQADEGGSRIQDKQSFLKSNPAPPEESFQQSPIPTGAIASLAGGGIGK